MTMLVVAVLALAVLRWVARRAGRRDTAGLLFALLLPASIGNPASALNVESTSRPSDYEASPQSCVYAYDAELSVLQGRPLGSKAHASVIPLSSGDQRRSVPRPCPASLAPRYDERLLVRVSRAGIATKPGVPDLPAYDGVTTKGVLITNEGQVIPLESGPINQYANYPAGGHVEVKAALKLKDLGSSGGTVYINNTNGIWGYCNTSVQTFLPEGVPLKVVPPANAVANNSRAIATAKVYTGNANTPKAPK